MGALVLQVDGLALRAADADAQLLVGDLQLARRVGLADPHSIRRTIGSAAASGLLSEGEDFVFSDSGSEKAGRGRPSKASYDLTRRGAVKVLIRLNTATAVAFTNYVVDTFLKAEEMRRPTLPPPPPPGVDVASVHRLMDGSQPVRDFPEKRRELADAIEVTALKLRVTRQAVAGSVRKILRRSSEYEAMLERLPTIIEHLAMLRQMGRLLQPRPPKPADPRQTVIPFPARRPRP